MKVRKGCDILFRKGKGGAFYKNMEQTSHTSGGTRGLDVFKIAGRSISGYLHSFKTAHDSHVRIPFTTLSPEKRMLQAVFKRPAQPLAVRPDSQVSLSVSPAVSQWLGDRAHRSSFLPNPGRRCVRTTYDK